MSSTPQQGVRGKKGDGSELWELPSAFSSSPQELYRFSCSEEVQCQEDRSLSPTSCLVLSHPPGIHLENKNKKAYFLVWHKMKEKILFGWHMRAGLGKHDNSEGQWENCSVVAEHSNQEWDEVLGNWIEAKWSKTTDPAKPPSMGAAIPMFYSDNQVQLGCRDYYLTSGLASQWISYWQHRWRGKIWFCQQRMYRILTSRELFSLELNFLFTFEPAFCKGHKLHTPLARSTATNIHSLSCAIYELWNVHFQNSYSTCMHIKISVAMLKKKINEICGSERTISDKMPSKH